MNNNYGYPMMYSPYSGQAELDKEITRLQNLRNQNALQPFQAPVQNIINANNPPKVELEGKILTDGQNAKDVIVANRTIFIDEFNKKVSIKEEDGSISKEYEIIIPKTPEQIEIEELKNTNGMLLQKINQMEVLINEYSKLNQPVEDVKQSIAIDDGVSKSSTKKPNK